MREQERRGEEWFFLTDPKGVAEEGAVQVDAGPERNGVHPDQEILATAVIVAEEGPVEARVEMIGDHQD